MKKITFLLVVLFSINSINAQNSYDIKINLKHCKDTIAYLTFYQFDKNMIVDTCTNIKNGKIVFNGKKKLYKGIYSLVGQGKSIYFDFIVDDDNQNLDISSESVSNYKELLQCSNSKIQNDFFNYIKYFEVQRVEFESYLPKTKGLSKKDSTDFMSSKQKIIGILLGFAGLLLSVTAGKTLHFDNFSYSFFVVLATIFYGLNVNMVGSQMQKVSAINIASVAFCFTMIPAGIILFSTGYFDYDFSNPSLIEASIAGGTLGVINTSIASIMFYVLVKRAGIIFASTVTYAIPFVSLAIGLYYNEPIHPLRLVGLGIILCGVYIVNKQKK